MLQIGTRVQTALNIEDERINADCAAAISGQTGVVKDQKFRSYDSFKDSFVLIEFDQPIKHWSDPSPHIFVHAFWVPRRFVGEYVEESQSNNDSTKEV